MPERELLVRIVGDDRDFQRALRNTERSTQRIDNRMQSFGRSAKGAFAAAGIAVGGAAVFAGLERSVAAASDLNEQISKSRQVFKESSVEVEAWSRTTAQGIGISQRAALTAAGTFGNLFNAVGLVPKVAADMSKSLVTLAADLGSFNNVTNPEEVLVALRSGLVGEAEPLRRFGVLLSEARVQTEAMAATGKTNVKSLTDQEKALARYNIILHDTVPAQGDFARTSGGLAQQQKQLKANMEDVSAELGNTLVPSLTAATVGMNKLAGGTLNVINSLRELRGSIQETDVFEGFNQGVEQATSGIGGFFLSIRDGIPLVNDLRDAIAGSGIAATEFGPTPEGRVSPGVVSASNRDVEAKKSAARTAKAAKDLEASRKAFAESIKGLGLKLDKAGLTASEQDDLAVIREIEQRIQRQIEVEGRTFDLEQALVRARSQEQAILEQISADGEKKQTKSVKKIADKAKEEREKRKRIRDQAAAQRKAEQFQALGLTEEGDKPTPSSGALLRRAHSIQEQVKGTTFDTSKTRKQLNLIVTFLKKNFKTAGKEVREAILSMLNDINTAGDDSAKKGPLTKTSSLNSKKVLANLGLSPEEIRALRGRLSNFNSAGVGFAGANNTRTTGSFSAPVVVESHVTVNLDGQKVASSVTRNQQKTKKRNPQQKRGPNRR